MAKLSPDICYSALGYRELDLRGGGSTAVYNGVDEAAEPRPKGSSALIEPAEHPDEQSVTGKS